MAILKACRNKNIVAFLGEYVDRQKDMAHHGVHGGVLS